MDNETLYITDAKSLEQTIERVEARIKWRELELKDRFNKLPQEGFKSALSMLLPSFLSARFTGATLAAAWNLGRVVTGHPKAIIPLLGAAAKAGLFSFFKNKIPFLRDRKK